MDKRIKMSEKEMCNYFIREQKVMEYGYEFFAEICACSMSTPSCPLINNRVLPITCYNEMDEVLASIDQGINYKIVGGFAKASKKQAYIRIGIDTKNSILNKILKRTIRHEIIHYILWLLDLPYDDNSLQFWCLCYVYDGGAYEKLSFEDEKFYELFKEIYENQVKGLPLNAKNLIVGQMITSIGKIPIEKYFDFVMDLVKSVKTLYRIE